MKQALRTLFVVALATYCFTAFAQDALPQGGDGQRGMRMRMDGNFQGVFGTITKIAGNTVEVKQENGETATVKVSDSTTIRRPEAPQPGAEGGRPQMQTLALKDLKVGDRVAVRGTKEGDTWKAENIMQVPAGMEQQGRQRFQNFQGDLGKTMVLGTVKSIDAPKLTVERVDGVTQTIEADENTSIRKESAPPQQQQQAQGDGQGRQRVMFGGSFDPITMADIQVGDAVMARGEVKDGTFVPQNLTVLNPQMAKMMFSRYQQAESALGGAKNDKSGNQQQPK